MTKQAAKKAKTNAITKPVMYRGFIVVPHKDGFDLVDPGTGRWAHFPTQRFAKWAASFVTNLGERFQANDALDTLPEVDNFSST